MARRAIVFVLAIVVAVIVGLFARRGEVDAAEADVRWPGTAELRTQDVLLRARPERRPHRDVVLVVADDKSVEKYGKLPWSRSTWAAGLSRVQKDDAKVAVFDVAFDERTNRAADRALWETIANGRRTVLGMGYDAQQPQKWTPDDIRALRFLEKFAIADRVELRGAAATQQFIWPLFEPPVSDFTQSARGVGVFLRETDQDAVVRHARMLYLTKVYTPSALTAPLPPPPTVPDSRLNGFAVTLPSLALSAARQAFGLDKTDLVVRDDAIRVAGELDPPVVIPVDSFGRMIINYAGPAGTVRAYSFVDVATGAVPAGTFKDKVVHFGATATGAEETDRRLTPYGEMPRVEITANAVSSILERSYLVRSRGNDIVAALIAVAVVGGLLLGQSRPLNAFLTGIALMVLYLVIAWLVAAFGSLLLPILPALLVLSVSTVIATACAYIFAAQARPYPATREVV